MRVTKSIMTVTLLAGAVLAAGTLGGCTQIKQSQGYVVDETLVTSVQPGIDNKDSVAKTLGRPTFGSEFDSGEWYYISRNTSQLAFLQPKTTSQNIFKVTFDAKGNVAKVERRGMEEMVSVQPVKATTPTLGRSTSLFEDLFGGIGKFGSATNSTDSAGGTATGRDGPK